MRGARRRIRADLGLSASDGGSAHDAFRRAVAGHVGVPADHVALFWKGRVALYAMLRALGIGRGDEVVVPAFTCVAVPNAVLYTGAVPVYADIDDATYTVEPQAVEAAITPRTRAILAQNTFGLSSDLDALGAIAARHEAVVIDDCTHGLGGAYQGRPNGASAHAAFYSTQWSKPISTGLGGIAVTPDAKLAGDLRAAEGAAREPSAQDRALLRTMVLARERIITPRTLAAGRAIYRTVSRAGLVPGSSSWDEFAGAPMADGFVSGMSSWQARRGADRLRSLEATVRRRRANAHRYSGWLAGHGRTPAHEPPGSTHAFLRYPLRVREREAFLVEARRRRLDIGDWFDSPLYQATSDLAAWGYRWGSNPVAERATAEIVNLPTDPAPGELRRIEALLEESLDRVI